jgi:hypothetical protein
MAEIMKQTDEIRVETEQDAKSLIESFKQKADEGGYEIASYAATHKQTKDDDYYIVKIVKKW